MSYSLRPSDASLTDALRRIGRSQMETAIAEIDDPALDPLAAVLQLRKRCKKLRGLFRLVRPGLAAHAQENAAFRDLARSLAGLRDAGAMRETVAMLEQRFGARVGTPFFDGVRAALAASFPPPQADAVRAQLTAARPAFEAGLQRSAAWEVRGKAAKVLAGGVAKTCRRAVAALAAAADTETAEDLHEFRKWVKYHWYHLRLLRQVWPDAGDDRAGAARHLADALGDHHDMALFRLAVLPGLEAADAGLRDTLAGLIEAEERRLARDCLRRGRQLFAAPPECLGRQAAAGWKAWRD